MKTFKRKALSLTKRILLELAEEYVDLLALHRQAHSLDRVLHPDYYKAKERDRIEWQRRRALRALRESKMIATRKKGQQIFFMITAKGRRWLIQQDIVKAKRCVDGECILVTFDIPETQRHLRNYFRLFLAEHNFHQLHRSVWVSTFDVLRPLQAFIAVSRAKPWIDVFRVRRS